jgi:polyisoprenoid-binding protein YceI
MAIMQQHDLFRSRQHGAQWRICRARRAAVIALSALAILSGGIVQPRVARAAPARYVLDPNHMSIGFLISHVGFEKLLGTFREAQGTFVFDEQKPAVGDIDVTIKTASVFTNHDERDEHLRKPDFLWAERYPEITFRGTSAEQTGPRTGKVSGDLTIRGVTRPVVLDVVWNKSGQYPFGDMHYAAGISARTTIKRSDFGMTYAVASGLVGDEVEIILEFEAIRQPS